MRIQSSILDLTSTYDFPNRECFLIIFISMSVFSETLELMIDTMLRASISNYVSDNCLIARLLSVPWRSGCFVWLFVVLLYCPLDSRLFFLSPCLTEPWWSNPVIMMIQLHIPLTTARRTYSHTRKRTWINVNALTWTRFFYVFVRNHSTSFPYQLPLEGQIAVEPLMGTEYSLTGKSNNC